MSPIDQPPAGQPPTGQPPPPSRDNADASIPPAPPRIADRYTVLSLLGVGGMGSVYRVRDDSLDEVVALKMLRRNLVGQESERARFRQEVKLARRVAHPNVARVFDLGESGGDVYLTMEYIEGETLATLIQREAPLSASDLVTLGLSLCGGLSAVHDAGIVHRDFKPENVLRARDGRIALTDFGVARIATRAGALVQTQGLVLGTPDYMAPEQVEEVADLDARADIYALGVVLFEAITGRRPFQGTTALATAIARLTQPPPDPRSLRPGIGDGLANLISACLRKDRTQRPQTIAEVAETLSGLASGRTLSMIPQVTRPMPPAPSLPAPQMPQTRPGEKRVAVIPFRNLGGPGDEYVADGLTDDITDALAAVSGLRVRPRSTVARAAAAEPDPLVLGRLVEVDVIVEGSVRRAGDTLRIQARLLNVVDGFAVWAQRFDGPVADAFRLCDQVSQGVANALTVQADRERAPLENAAVFDLYLRGREAYHRLWRPSTREAVHLLNQAAEMAPTNTTILSGYAMALARAVAVDAGEPDARERLSAVCDTLLQLNPKLATPHLALASLRFQLGDALGAARSLRQALLLAPDHPDARELLGRMLIEAGQLEAGIGHLNVARSLEPAMVLARMSILRAEELRGNRHLLDAALQSGELSGVDPNLLWAHRSRAVAWRRDKVAAARDLAELETLDIEMGMAAKGTYMAVLDPIAGDRAVDILNAQFIGQHATAPRLRAFYCQLKAEFLAIGDRRGPAIGAIEEAFDSGLIDIGWLDLCPLFLGYERDPAFLRIRDRVRRRAEQVVSALNGIAPA